MNEEEKKGNLEIVFNHSEKIANLGKAEKFVREINKNLSHEVLIPMNSVCLLQRRIVNTNNVIIFRIFFINHIFLLFI